MLKKLCRVLRKNRKSLNLQGNLYFPVDWGGVCVGGGPGGVLGGVSVSRTTIIVGFR